MKSHVQLLPAQRREVNERIRAGFKAGYNLGCESALLFALSALYNLYGWGTKPLLKFLNEVLQFANASAEDRYMIDRMKIKMRDLGIEIHDKFDVEPPEYREKSK